MSRGYAAIGLHEPKNDLNVGGVLRAAGCYGAAMVAVGGERNGYRRASTDTQHASLHLPLLLVDELRSAVPEWAVPVAVDLVPDATPLPSFRHPDRAFYVFGPEDGTLGDDVLGWCEHAVMVPTRYCMNLAATVNVVLYDRMSKGKR